MTDKNTFVTIAIPFYNSEQFLADAIQSVVNQTYKNWELLLIDDGCTDSSPKIAQQYSKTDERIKYISDGKNRGLVYRLNESVQVAKGFYYARMDADDIMAIDRIETQVMYLEQHPDVDIVGSSAMIIDDKNNIIRSSDMCNISTGFIHPTVCGRTNWFRKYKYNEKCRRCQDWELWLRTAKCNKFYNIGRPLLFYRELGIPSLRKNLKAHQIQRYIFRGYKRYGESFSWYIKSTMATYVKDTVYLFFATIGKMDYLISKRRRKQLPKELWLTERDLAISTNTHREQ